MSPRTAAPGSIADLADLLNERDVEALVMPNHIVRIDDESGLSDRFVLVRDPMRMIWETAQLTRAGPAPLLFAALEQATRRAAADFGPDKTIPVAAVPMNPSPRSRVPEKWVVGIHLEDFLRLLHVPCSATEDAQETDP